MVELGSLRAFGSGGLVRSFPHLSGVVVEPIPRDAGVVTFSARARADAVRCPHCKSLSWRVHGRYERRLADAAVGTTPVVIRLVVRRFKCLSSGCPTVTFVEQIPGLTSPYARHTPVLRKLLARVAEALAGRAGARLVRRRGGAGGFSGRVHMNVALAGFEYPEVIRLTRARAGHVRLRWYSVGASGSPAR